MQILKATRKPFTHYLLLFCIALSASMMLLQGKLYAQTDPWRPIYSTKWGYLYQSADEQAEVLGVFATEASLRLLDSTDTYYKVQVSNDDIGYIKRQPLATRMFARVSEGEPAHYFYRGEEGRQGPHLRVQAAELRVRDRPFVEGKVLRRARLNEYVSIDYYPLYEGAWLYVGDHFHENPGYILASFVGKELTYKQVLEEYLQVKGKNPESEEKMVGRLREIAWSGKPDQLLQGLRYYEESSKKLGLQNPKIDIAFELRFAEKHQHYLTDFSAYEQAIRRLNMHYLIHDTELVDGKISDKQMLSIGLKKVKEIPDVPECGWYPMYFYTSPQVAVAFEENQFKKLVGSVYELKFSSDVALVLGDQRIDHTYSEDDFVATFGHLLETDWIETPHCYRIMNGDAGFFLLKFENGVAVSFASIFYC